MREKLLRLFRATAALGGFAFAVWLIVPPLVGWVIASTLTLAPFNSGQTGPQVMAKLNSDYTLIQNSVNNIDNSQLATNAAIAQSKLSLNLTAAPFTTLPSLLGPTGALKLTGLDQSQFAPGVFTDFSYRIPYGTEAALQSGVSGQNILTRYVNDSEPANLSSYVDLVHCSGTIYLLVNKTAGNADIVMRWTASSFAAQSDVALAADDDPVDLECGRDGSVYVLTNGAASRTVKKITAGGVVSTVVNLNAAVSADNLIGFVSDPNTQYLFVAGQDNTVSANRQLMRVDVAAGTATISAALGPDNETEITDLFWCNRNGNSRVIVLSRDVTGAGRRCEIYGYTTAGPPAITGSAGTVDSAPTASTNECASMVFDGHWAWVLGLAAGGFGATIMNMEATEGFEAALRLGSTKGFTWTTQPSGDPQFSMFNGHHLALQTAAATLNLVRPNTKTELADALAVLPAAATTPCGVATNGRETYVCGGNAGLAVNITRLLP